MSVELHHGDCIAIMREMPESTVDSIVTDPPYGIIGHDNQPAAAPTGICVECGDDLVAEGLAHCSDCLLRDPALLVAAHAGHGGRTMLGHVSKNWHEKGTHSRGYVDNDNHAFQAWSQQWLVEAYRVLKPGGYLLAFGGTRTWHRLAVAVEDAGFEIRDSIAWMHGQGFPKGLNFPDGWGTALKPAFEPVVVGRKPITGTVALTRAQYGTGAMNIDASRIGERFPSNVILDESQLASLESQGGSPKFFYAAKPGKKERPAVGGLTHPTVKPLGLMRYLVRLATPTGGTVLEPFAGSGTTLEAAAIEGFRVIGIEREADYLPLIHQRLERVGALLSFEVPA